MKILVIVFLIILMSSCIDSKDSGINGNYTIELNDTEIKTNSSSAVIDDSTITIMSHGNYTITGKLSDGQIIVNAANSDVNLILNNVDITCSDNSPIYIMDAKHTVITIPENTVNTLTDGNSYTYKNTNDTEPDATLFSKDDLSIKGAGKLTINANYNDALTSKDALKIEGCNIVINSKNHGIKGRDYLVIIDSEINVTSENDGIKSTNDKDIDLGYIKLTNSTININAVDEAISAINNITIIDGTLNIDTKNNGIKSEKSIDFQSGVVVVKTLDDDFIAPVIKGTEKAIITVNGSAYDLN